MSSAPDLIQQVSLNRMCEKKMIPDKNKEDTIYFFVFLRQLKGLVQKRHK